MAHQPAASKFEAHLIILLAVDQQLADQERAIRFALRLRRGCRWHSGTCHVWHICVHRLQAFALDDHVHFANALLQMVMQRILLEKLRTTTGIMRVAKPALIAQTHVHRQ